VDERARLTMLLEERGIVTVAAIMAGLEDEDLTAAFGAVAAYDDLTHVGNYAARPGLLAKWLRDGGQPGYKRAHERTPVEGEGPSGKLRTSIRGVLGSPDGFSRADAVHFYRAVARRHDVAPEVLVESAMGQGWIGTPPHPAKDLEEDQLATAIRYDAWVGGHCDHSPDLDCLPIASESDFEYSCRFWGWRDPPDFEQRLADARAAVEERKRTAEAAETAEAERRLPAQQELAVESAPSEDEIDPDQEF
jgi:hypothetical protein